MRIISFPRKTIMYKIHRKITAQLCKIEKKLDERNALAELKSMHGKHMFDCINEKLNDVTKHFINSQLRNVDRTPAGKLWIEEDKAFALSIYKRSPRVYRYLATYFQLPSTRTLKYMLSKIPFDTGVNKLLLQQLKVKSDEMHELDRYCALVFDEISLSNGFYYESHKQQISGFEDLGELGRTSRAANHALVFMIRGLRKSYKQVIAYYFTAGTISSSNLKSIITNIIKQLQEIGIKVKATVCDQGSTQRKALSELCLENTVNPTCYTFVVKSETVVTIYDVPHLLKCTRNALLRCNIRFAENKVAKFQYIRNAFDVELNFKFRQLYKLSVNDFNFKDSFIKMRVKTAARQLSHTVAAIQSHSISNVNGLFPVESLQTAEFSQLIDDLFDSLNSSSITSDEGKMYRCCLQEDSPHLELWSRLLPEMANWKLIDFTSDQDVTNQFQFVKGWAITIRAVIYLWHQLKTLGFKFLNMRNLNQDPLENLFCQIRQHGIANTNPICHQFIAALKTVVLNNLVAPVSKYANCERDNCENLNNFRNFLNSASEIDEYNENEQSMEKATRCFPQWVNFEELDSVASQALSYVTGYLVKRLKVPDENCLICRTDLFCTQEEHHLFTVFKENSEKESLTYPSNRMITLIENVHNRLYQFLNEYGHKSNLESIFKQLFFNDYKSEFCDIHRCDNIIVENSLTFLIFKYVKEKKKPVTLTSGYYEKTKQFQSQ